jgi:RNA-directed DNA polymerase
LLMCAGRRHTRDKWVLLYIERWLTAPVQLPDGSIQKRTAGTPQGGVITPFTQKITLNLNADFH